MHKKKGFRYLFTSFIYCCMHVSMAVYSHIYLYTQYTYAPERCEQYICSAFAPRKLMLHSADIAMVQFHSSSTHRAAVSA